MTAEFEGEIFEPVIRYLAEDFASSNFEPDADQYYVDMWIAQEQFPVCFREGCCLWMRLMRGLMLRKKVIGWRIGDRTSLVVKRGIRFVLKCKRSIILLTGTMFPMREMLNLPISLI